MFPIVFPVITLIVGLFSGSWITYRGHANKSPIPLPSLPAKKPEQPVKPFVVKS